MRSCITAAELNWPINMNDNSASDSCCRILHHSLSQRCSPLCFPVAYKTTINPSARKLPFEVVHDNVDGLLLRQDQRIDRFPP